MQTTVIWATDLVGNQGDMGEVDRLAKVRVNRPTGQVLARRPKEDKSGKVIAYEVDIR